MVRVFWCCVVLWVAGPASAELNSLFAPTASADSGIVVASVNRSGLFSTEGNQGFFAPLPDRTPSPPPPEPSAPIEGTGSSAVDHLLTLIARAEAGSAGYDAVQHGARVKPSARPTQMTLGEIYAWIDATPGQPHAIGRYQFIPPTLRRVAATRGFGPETPFSPGVQDALALVLLEDAGLSRFEAGEMSRRTFMRNLAKIWAGLPLPNGLSYYHGHAGNRASMTWAAFSGGMAEIWGS